MLFGSKLKKEFKTALSIIKFDIYRLFNKKKIEASKKDLALMCSAQIGQALIHELANSRKFRRTIERESPWLLNVVDKNIELLNNTQDEQ